MQINTAIEIKKFLSSLSSVEKKKFLFYLIKEYPNMSRGVLCDYIWEEDILRLHEQDN